MDIRVSFPGGMRVDAAFDELVVRTDQPEELGGEGSAPAPFDLFLASLATCAGAYVVGFCRARGIPTEGLEIVQRHGKAEDGKTLASVDLEIRTPPGFPEKYLPAIVRAAEGCKVKQLRSAPPADTVRASTPPAAVEAMASV